MAHLKSLNATADTKVHTMPIRTIVSALEAGADLHPASAFALKAQNPALARLLASAGITQTEADGTISLAKLDLAFKPLNLEPTQRMAAKAALRQRNLLSR